jgi:hypothetical protein
LAFVAWLLAEEGVEFDAFFEAAGVAVFFSLVAGGDSLREFISSAWGLYTL